MYFVDLCPLVIISSMCTGTVFVCATSLFVLFLYVPRRCATSRLEALKYHIDIVPDKFEMKLATHCYYIGMQPSLLYAVDGPWMANHYATIPATATLRNQIFDWGSQQLACACNGGSPNVVRMK